MALCGAAGTSSAKVTMAGEDSEMVAWILPEVICRSADSLTRGS
jgi:hypothetical protein